jgi:predicted nucleic acid-binding protein
MGTVTVFFDTYAFFEILKKNPRYSHFLEKFPVITTRINLMELYFGLIKNYGVKTADYVYDYLLKYATDINDEIIKEAMQFKFQNKTRRLSYVDCIGYITALRNSARFLTGDRQFRDLENVEFVQ